jgi:hypothetical protein
MPSKPSHALSPGELVHLTGIGAKIALRLPITAITTPFKERGEDDKKGYIRHVLYDTIHNLMTAPSTKEVQWVHPSTGTSVKMVAGRKRIKVAKVKLPHGTKAYWLNYNEKTRKNVIVWLHGESTLPTK